MDRTGLLSKLQELNISSETVDHAAAMTCDEQAAALQSISAVITKNLLIKDKKNRIYLITAQADTNVDLKTLSARLGTGKGGVRLAPDELLGSVLQVPLGSCTPLALCQPTAANVALLLDAKLKGQERIAVHPLVNTASTVISAAGLEVFLRSLGREPLYVDLEAEPKIDKDNPPDLRAVADAAVPYPKEGDEQQGAVGQQQPAAVAAAAATKPAAPAAAAAGPKKAAKAAPKAAPGAAAAKPRGDDVQKITDAVIQMVLSVGMGAEAAAAVEPDTLRRLTADVAMELNALRNAAYANGFTAAKSAIAGAISRQFA